MNTRFRYAHLGILALVGLYTGAWAYCSPAGWYMYGTRDQVLNVVFLAALVLLAALLLVPILPARRGDAR